MRLVNYNCITWRDVRRAPSKFGGFCSSEDPVCELRPDGQQGPLHDELSFGRSPVGRVLSVWRCRQYHQWRLLCVALANVELLKVADGVFMHGIKRSL